jgi:hypothetical protein
MRKLNSNYDLQHYRVTEASRSPRRIFTRKREYFADGSSRLRPSNRLALDTHHRGGHHVQLQSARDRDDGEPKFDGPCSWLGRSALNAKPGFIHS